MAADGRHSILRKQAGLEVMELGAPMDVLWMRLSRRDDDPGQTLGRIDAGRMMVMLNRGDYWQCAFVISKGGYPARDELARLTGVEPDQAQTGAKLPVINARCCSK